MLVERQGDVEMIDPLALGDLSDLGERAEQGKAAIADVVAPGAIVDEADDLQSQLTIEHDAVGDQAPELARAGDEDPLQADPGAPAALEELADRLARPVRDGNGQHEEDQPHQL